MDTLRTDPEQAVPALRQRCAELNIRTSGVTTAAALVDKLGGVVVEEAITRPSFVVEHPLVLSPLAMAHPTKVGIN